MHICRLIRDPFSAGGCAINYARAAAAQRDECRVCGAVIKTQARAVSKKEVLARVASSTGPWSDEVRPG